MKKITLKLLSLTTLMTFTLNAQKLVVDTSKSVLKWEGRKFKGTKLDGAHNGTLKFKEGSFVELKNGTINAGTLSIDMTSLTVTDLKPGKGKESLEDHLKNEDFFNVEQYKTASLNLKPAKNKMKGSTLGDLKILDKTNEVSFKSTLNTNDKKALATLEFNRSKFGMTYKSKSLLGKITGKIKDKFIDDTINLEAEIFFK